MRRNTRARADGRRALLARDGTGRPRQSPHSLTDSRRRPTKRIRDLWISCAMRGFSRETAVPCGSVDLSFLQRLCSEGERCAPDAAQVNLSHMYFHRHGLSNAGDHPARAGCASHTASPFLNTIHLEGHGSLIRIHLRGRNQGKPLEKKKFPLISLAWICLGVTARAVHDPCRTEPLRPPACCRFCRGLS